VLPALPPLVPSPVPLFPAGCFAGCFAVADVWGLVPPVGLEEAVFVGLVLGSLLGCSLGWLLGCSLGLLLGRSLGLTLGLSDAVLVGVLEDCCLSGRSLWLFVGRVVCGVTGG
jgi:hypothetical protein